MSDFVGKAINTADLVSKLTGIAVDFLSGIGCEAFCEVDRKSTRLNSSHR